jgi:hypothetical protein
MSVFVPSRASRERSHFLLLFAHSRPVSRGVWKRCFNWASIRTRDNAGLAVVCQSM